MHTAGRLSPRGDQGHGVVPVSYCPSLLCYAAKFSSFGKFCADSACRSSLMQSQPKFAGRAEEGLSQAFPSDKTAFSRGKPRFVKSLNITKLVQPGTKPRLFPAARFSPSERPGSHLRLRWPDVGLAYRSLASPSGDGTPLPAPQAVRTQAASPHSAPPHR